MTYSPATGSAWLVFSFRLFPGGRLSDKPGTNRDIIIFLVSIINYTECTDSLSLTMLMWLRLTEASSSLCPPERKQMPGTAAGTVLQGGNSIDIWDLE